MPRFEKIRHFVANEIVDLGMPEGAVSRDDMRRTRILSISSLALCIFAGLPSVAWLLRLGIPSLTGMLVAAMVAAVLNLLALRAWRRPRLAANVGVGILASLLISSNVFTGGFYESTFSLIYLLPLAGAAILDVRGAVAWTGITIGVSVAFWLLPGLGIELVSQVPEPIREGNALFSRVTALCGIGILALSFVAAQRRVERELAAAHREVVAETAYVQLLMHAAVAANEAESFEAAMLDSMRRICETMDWMAGHIYFVAEDGSIGTSGITHSRDPRILALSDHARDHRFQKGADMLGLAVSEAMPQIVDVSESRHDPEGAVSIALPSGIRAAMAVPVFVDGSVPAVMLFASASPLADQERLSEVFSLIGVELGKVAERTALQGRVQQSQKMEAVGQLAAGVAHEINNPMSYVRTNLHTLRDEWAEMRSKLADEDSRRLSDFEELIDESLEGVERTIAIVRDVKEFSHRGAADPRDWSTVELGELLDGALRVVASQAAADVSIEACHEGTALCRCAPNQIRQVFVNLIVNAIQAVGSSGRILLTTGTEGDEAFARVEDDGPGFGEATRARLFDPFFTTKPVGVGTGLGLSVSYEIVRNHDGEIQVSSEPGDGACFEVRLPIDPA